MPNLSRWEPCGAQKRERLVEEPTNALKHAGPPDGELRPAARRPERRFNARLRSARYEVGVVGMAERAVLYGGTVSAGPAPDGGWTVHVTLEGSHS